VGPEAPPPVNEIKDIPQSETHQFGKQKQCSPNEGVSPDRAQQTIKTVSENCCIEADTALTQAAEWYASHRDNCPRPVILTLRRKCGLSPLETCLAIRIANGGVL
jgi:hypothetical protein